MDGTHTRTSAGETQNCEQSELFEGFIEIEILQPNFYIVNWHVEFFLEKG